MTTASLSNAQNSVRVLHPPAATTQSTSRKRRERENKNTPQASDEQSSFQLGSMGAAFFKCERKVLLSFAILRVDLELGLIAHQASTGRGGRADQRQ